MDLLFLYDGLHVVIRGQEQAMCCLGVKGVLVWCVASKGGLYMGNLATSFS